MKSENKENKTLQFLVEKSKDQRREMKTFFEKKK